MIRHTPITPTGQRHVFKEKYSNAKLRFKSTLPTSNDILSQQGIGCRVGLVVRALAFHQCGPLSISALGVIRGLSLLVLYSAMRGFPQGTPVFPSHQKATFDLI